MTFDDIDELDRTVDAWHDRRRRDRVTGPIALVICLVLAATGAWMVSNVFDRVEDTQQAQAAARERGDLLRARATALEDRSTLLEENYAELYSQLEDLGEKPVAPPVDALPAPPPPVTGIGPTLTQLLGALDVYCTPRNDCVGARGAEGPPGPAPTDAQVAAVLAAYCAARNDCVGPTGGAGPAAPRVTDIDCDGTTGVYEFSDDTTIRVDGQCPEPIVITPSPTPTE